MEDNTISLLSVISKSLKYRKIQDTNEKQESTGQLQKYRNLQDLQDRWDHCGGFCSMAVTLDYINSPIIQHIPKLLWTV